ncbi:unnamed protein product [Lampetra planeri]
MSVSVNATSEDEERRCGSGTTAAFARRRPFNSPCRELSHRARCRREHRGTSERLGDVGVGRQRVSAPVRVRVFGRQDEF